ncbi:Inner membrane protein YiaW [Planctomycetes bacterium CA13]|uniref:Inner membrane protein YiaW n=1 Tax=Novipirellula herctigrandis TaxID=2527986 RepID=A0A5C5Z365_9BACT|nr:Inner membrane protein YiaW [Planctomycetes bacterium CA13]
MLHIFAFLVLLFALAALVYVVIVLGGLPGKIAHQREHPQAEAINVCGWVGLLTGVFWMVALVWAFTKTMTVTDSRS